MTVGTACVLDGLGLRRHCAVVPAGTVKTVSVEHPTGEFSVELEVDPANPQNVTRAALLRTARLLMRGEVMIPASVWKGKPRDHRLPRPLHDRAQGAGGLAQPPDRRPQGPGGRAEGLASSRSATTTLRESIETNQLAKMKERGSDLTIFSPRASFMAHHIGDFETSATWAAICNELCYRVSRLFPDHFIGAAMLPQSPGVDPEDLHSRAGASCVKEYGFVAINLNPDPSGGHWTAPPLTDRHWYPIYEKMVEYDIPAMIHVSTSCNRVLPHDRRALPQRRHDGVHAVPDRGPVQGLPDAAVRDPARRRRGALPLGPLPRPRAGTEEAAAQGPPAEQHLLRHLRLPPAGHRPADQGDPGRQRAVRLGDDRRGARHRSRRPASTTTTRGATSRPRRSPRTTATRSTKATRGGSTRGSTPRSRPRAGKRTASGRNRHEHERPRHRPSATSCARTARRWTSSRASASPPIHEAMGRVGLMKPYMRPIYAGAHLCGTAVTVLLQPGDNWMLHVAAEQLRDGDVVVAACTTDNDDGFFGDLLATSFRARGAQGPRHRRRRARRQGSDRDAVPGVLARDQRQGHRQGHARARSTSRWSAPARW